MAQINVSNLTFAYEGSYDNIFEGVSFCVDTDWKLGFIGRNGRGKSTFLNLLLGKHSYQGSISTSVCFDYFPYQMEESMKNQLTIEVIEKICPDYELWKICRELDQLKTDAEILYRAYNSLSFGEQTKVMLAILFSHENHFLLIDEPTNHLDMPTRRMVAQYLNSKKGFILVSHDRKLLDECVDHVLVINKMNIEVQKGNFSSWWENKKRQDQYEQEENVKLKKEINQLTEAARRTARWADKNERTKIGFDPIKEPDRFKNTRSYIGAKTKSMQKRRKCLEQRQQSAIEEKSGLLKNIEDTVELKLSPLEHYKENYVHFREVSLFYGSHQVFEHLSFDLKKGDRLVLQGKNGCGKSSVVKAILSSPNVELMNDTKDVLLSEPREVTGEMAIPKGLKVSYISQDTSHLKGCLNEYILSIGEDESLFKAILRKLDFERVQFEKRMEDYSEGQKKKVLIVSSLLCQAHLYIWDEPLNYIDVFSRIQIENLIQEYQPTMLIIEHDETFCKDISTDTIHL